MLLHVNTYMVKFCVHLCHDITIQDARGWTSSKPVDKHRLVKLHKTKTQPHRSRMRHNLLKGWVDFNINNTSHVSFDVQLGRSRFCVESTLQTSIHFKKTRRMRWEHKKSIRQKISIYQFIINLVYCLAHWNSSGMHNNFQIMLLISTTFNLNLIKLENLTLLNRYLNTWIYPSTFNCIHNVLVMVGLMSATSRNEEWVFIKNFKKKKRAIQSFNLS